MDLSMRSRAGGEEQEAPPETLPPQHWDRCEGATQSSSKDKKQGQGDGALHQAPG